MEKLSIKSCQCKEKCFFIEKTILNKDSNYDKIQVYKCNRLNKNSELYSIKKKPCEFYEEYYIKELIVDDSIKENNDIDNTDKKSKIETTIKNIGTVKTGKSSRIINKLSNKKLLNDLNKLIEYYDIRGTNYFCKLNSLLINLNYDIHEPCKETIAQLKYRIENKIYKSKNNIYKLDKFDDEEERPLVFRCDEFDWFDDNLIIPFVNKYKNYKTKKKNPKKKKETNVQKLELDMSTLLINNDESDEENKKENKKENNVNALDEESDNEKELENELDIEEEISDIEDNNEDYYEFSD